MPQKTSKTQNNHERKAITILSVPVDNIPLEQALAKISKFAEGDKLRHIVTVNPEFLVIAHKNTLFKKVLQEADLALADGVGLQFAALLQGKKFVMRVPGRELVYRLMPQAERDGIKIFLLGAGPNVAKTAAQNLVVEHPKLKVSFSDADPDTKGTKKALAQINRFKPHVLLVAYGAPTQDLWIAKNRNKINAQVAIGVGGTIDFLAGKVKKAPEVISKFGLEWLYRLILEPWRIKRQLRLPYFVWLVLRERLTTIKIRS